MQETPTAPVTGGGRSMGQALSARLDGLSPFWIVFSLTLTETVGASILALPIAVAGAGPIPGIILLVLLGIVNMMTIGALAEAFTRDGTVRSGRIFISGLVASYLGRQAALVIRALVLLLGVLVLAAYYIGVATTFGDEYSISPTAVTAVLFVVGVIFMSRGSLATTASTAMVIGAVNIVLILAMSALVLLNFHPGYLGFVDTPVYGGHHFSIHLLGLLTGVIIASYFGHLTVAGAASTVLQRDPSGRSLLWGGVAAQGTVIVLYVLWVVAVNGAIPRADLLADNSTVLVPLSLVSGPTVKVLGLVFVILAMGMASVQASMTLRSLTEEWLTQYPRLWSRVPRGPGRFALSISVVLVVFVATEALLQTGSVSFSGLLAYIGVAVVTIVAGLLPALLLLATRRKGDRMPGLVLDFLGSRIALTGLYILFLAIILVHAVFIWTNPEERVSALLLVLLVAWLTLSVLRAGIFQGRVVVELLVEGDSLSLNATTNCRPVFTGEGPVLPDHDPPEAGPVRRATSDIATYTIPASAPRQLRIKIQRAPEAEPAPTAVIVTLEDDAGVHPVELGLNQDTMVMLAPGSARLTGSLHPATMVATHS
jgi:amino acid permease